MSRSAILFALLVLAPAGVLAFFAFRAAEQDYLEGLNSHRTLAMAEAEALGRRIESAVADAARSAEKALSEEPDGSVGFSKDGEWLRYSPDEGAETPPTAEEARLFERSLRGGESYEHAQGDPARAVDAYGFYLPRLRSQPLRARLRYRVARATLASGDEFLAEAIFRDLLKEEDPRALEEGIPVALLSALALRDEDQVGRLVRHHLPRLSTPLLGHLKPSLGEGGGLERVLERRRAIEEAVARHPELLSTREAVLGGGWLVMARPQGSVRALACAPVELPPLEAGPLEARLEYPSAGSVPPDGPGRTEHGARRPVRLGKEGPEVAQVVVSDPELPARVAALGSRRDLQRALVGLLAISTLGGGLALLRYVARERKLARLRTRLLQNVSHELKTPVTSIRMFSELLAEDPAGGERTRRVVDLLRSESLRLSTLTENLLDVSRLGGSEKALPLEPVDLGALLDQVAEGFSFRAREKGVEFLMEDGPLPPLRSNAPAIERILANLLDNALKYRKDAGARIRLRAEDSGGQVRIAVEDNGPGIARGHQEKVFEEFYRVRFDDYGVQGTGLGLSIARRLARKLGGEITLRSREGAGSVFTLVLPRNGA